MPYPVGQRLKCQNAVEHVIVGWLVLLSLTLASLRTVLCHGHHPTNHHTHTVMERMMAPRNNKIMSESDILMEEIIKSTENADGERLFDADVPGKIGQPGVRRRRKRQVDQDDIKNALCRDKNPGEFFRLVAGVAHCRDVVACADHGLQAIRCPPGLAFDLGKQTCEWKQEVRMLMRLTTALR